MKDNKDTKIGILGMGYVGLPLAIEFSKYFQTLGFDIKDDRIFELKKGKDSSNEFEYKKLENIDNLKFTSDMNDLINCNIYIVTVPTPIDENNKPNLKPLFDATKKVGSVLSKGDTVIYESTVYPGATEEDCVPILEKISRLKLNKDFFVGYSPERINPGDKEHKLSDIVKVTSGSSLETANFVDNLYKKIITVGTYKASSIREAEAAKVIENTQRDLNIALTNELAIIFDKMGLDTEGVLKAASTKWNFLSFKPGLVGGHCIGVDPYYLTFKAESLGYRPEIILSGRHLNDTMSSFVVNKLIKEMDKRKIKVNESNILIMGIAFKENCSDIRNSKVVDVVTELGKHGCQVSVFDPLVCENEVEEEYGIKIIKNIKQNKFDAIIVAVGHLKFKEMGFESIKKFGRKESIIFDLKYLFSDNKADLKL